MNGCFYLVKTYGVCVGGGGVTLFGEYLSVN